MEDGERPVCSPASSLVSLLVSSASGLEFVVFLSLCSSDRCLTSLWLALILASRCLLHGGGGGYCSLWFVVSSTSGIPAAGHQLGSVMVTEEVVLIAASTSSSRVSEGTLSLSLHLSYDLQPQVPLCWTWFYWGLVPISDLSSSSLL